MRILKNRRKKVQELVLALEPYERSNFGSKESDEVEDEAKRALQECFSKLKDISPDKVHKEDRHFYMVNLMLFADALRKRQYAYACNELRTLNYNSEMLQQRVYFNLLMLYNKHLGGDVPVWKLFKAKEKKRQSEYLGGIKFDETIDLAQSWVSGKPKEEQIILLDYMMEVIKTAMCIGEKVGTFGRGNRCRFEFNRCVC